MASVAPTEIGQRIKAARKRKRWTQLEFALEANVSPATVQRWEAGKLPRVRELIRVAELLDVSTDELVQAEDEGDDGTQARLARIELLLEELLSRCAPNGRLH